MKCFYHSADLDGHCSGAIVKKFNPECEMIGINYGQPFPWETITEGEEVYMVDFSLQPFSEMQRLNDMCKLHWIDHHKTAINDAFNISFLASGGQSLELDKAGCELTWQYFSNNIIPYAVYLLGRYDIWDHSNADTLPFQYGMRQNENTYPDNIDLWNKLFESSELLYTTLDYGKLILKYEDSQNKKFCKAYAFETEFNGMRCICINKGFTNSKVFASVYDPNIHYMMITFCRMKLPSGKWTVSLYSTRDDIDCGMIAKSFGGGGHKQAAGFQCTEIPFKI